MLRILPSIGRYSRFQRKFIRALGTISDNGNLSINNNSEKVLTMSEAYSSVMKRLGLEANYTPIPKSREDLRKYEPKVEDLSPRAMTDSFTSVILPLKTDIDLHNRYVSITGNVRLGRLLEDMDMFAVWSIYRHVHLPKLPKNIPLPYTFVTILVDKVSFSDYTPKSTEDIRISGHVSWVGSSSIEIVVWLEQLENDKYRKITRALFLMAARNATNTGPLPVNPIKAVTDEEKNILAGGELRKKHRQKLQAQSIFKVEPNDFEQSIIYELYKRTMPMNTMQLNKFELPPNCRWISESRTSNTIAAFPEHRNLHNTVFGGFIMRNALEISWANAYMFSKSRPKLMQISDISFDKPVGVNSFITMTSYIVYTELNYIQVMTIVDTIHAPTNTQSTSNTFYCTFRAADLVPEVLPRTYQEAMWYIQGRRKFRSAIGGEEA